MNHRSTQINTEKRLRRKEAVIVKVRVQPKASRNAILGEHNGALKIGVTAAPEKGKANKAAIDVLAKALRIPKSSVVLVTGAASRDKTFAVTGTTHEAIKALAERERS